MSKEIYNLNFSKTQLLWMYQAMSYMRHGLTKDKEHKTEPAQLLATDLTLSGVAEIQRMLRQIIPTAVTNMLDAAPKYEASGISLSEWAVDYDVAFKQLSDWIGLGEIK